MFRSIFFAVIGLILVSLAASSFLAGRTAQPKPIRSLFDLMPSAEPARPEIAPSGSAAGGFEEMEIAPDRSGNYVTEAEIDGYPIRMVVDTGASFVSLTNADASAIGIRPAPADFTYRTMTANGTGTAAKVRLGTLRIGPMEINDVEAFVMPPGVLGTSLLGMSALSRLGKVEISAGRLVLRQ